MVLERYIRRVYNSKYTIFQNNCSSKSCRIVRAARILGYNASLMICISHPTRSALFGWPVYTLHTYAIVDGEKVDVSFDPELEEHRMRNEDVEMTRGIRVPWV